MAYRPNYLVMRIATGVAIAVVMMFVRYLLRGHL